MNVSVKETLRMKLEAHVFDVIETGMEAACENQNSLEFCDAKHVLEF